jgi:PKD repeat protein
VPIKVLYNIVPTAGNCGGSGFPLEVVVNPTPFLPTLRDTICTGQFFETIPANNTNGAIVPANTTYTWSTPVSQLPGVVTGGSAQPNQQNIISQQLFNFSDAPAQAIYQITPVSGSFGNCVGLPFDLVVAVNPDARAIFDPIDTIGCAPFIIDGNRVRLQPKSSANATYNWFIDGAFIGDGIVFPGFTMRSPDDTISLKLAVTSLYGCKPDSSFRRFYTYKIPTPSFAISDSVGCGPLVVNITNNTAFKDLFTYRWSFGNGLTSFQADPPPVTYLSNSSFGDTVYVMKLDVNSVCGTYSTETRIRVKSRPKALFTPSSTIGCSPMKVTFNNTSRGLNNRYIWNFGDGRIDSTNALGLFEHTFITALRDTFTVKLYAINECGTDSASYDIIVSPNTIKLDYAVNGTQKEGCVTHRVDFINNTIGATLFRWDFGDGNIRSTTKNIDTVSHIYLEPGTYNVKLLATNGCTDTTAVEQIIVYGLPTAEFFNSRNEACIGDSIFFLNKSIGADSYLWKFSDGRTSVAVNPGHRFAQSGEKEITLIAYKSNAPGIVCVDSTVRTVRITDSVYINFNY